MISMPGQVVSMFDSGEYQAHVRRGAELLKSGGLVILPTETVYGLASVLTQPAGLERLKQMRGGDFARPFTIHLADRKEAAQYLDETNDFAKRVMTKLWPGPVGLMFEVSASRRAAVAKQLNLPESDLYDGPTITLRCP